jgi:hypothetical protein
VLVKDFKTSNLKNKLATIFLLSTVLSCSTAFADCFTNENFFDFIAQKNTQKLYNPIHLDTSKIKEKSKEQSETSIPYNLREFNESEYFTSTIEEPQYSRQTLPPKDFIE